MGSYPSGEAQETIVVRYEFRDRDTGNETEHTLCRLGFDIISSLRLRLYLVKPPLSYDASPPFLPASLARSRSPPTAHQLQSKQHVLDVPKPCSELTRLSCSPSLVFPPCSDGLHTLSASTLHTMRTQRTCIRLPRPCLPSLVSTSLIADPLRNRPTPGRLGCRGIRL